jgi:riboflavin kinase/FMN adenylyltransferase
MTNEKSILLMEVVSFREDFSSQCPVIVTIGNFDGMHLGHQFIIRKVVDEARQRRCAGILITFDPHPQEVLHPQKAIAKICTPELRNRLLREMGLDAVYIIHFTPGFSRLSGEEFARDFLINRFNLVKLLIGHDFHFGKKRTGNAALLERFSKEHCFELEEIAPIRIGKQTVSSTLIRQLIRENRFDEIPQFLGRPYSIYASVEKGEQRGRTLGFPTANFSPQINIPLESGVYVTHAQVREQMYHGITNIGFRPTFGHDEQRMETFIFDFSGEIYGEKLEIWPLKQLRKEKKFPGVDALKQQIEMDIKEAHSYFQSQ